MPKQDIQLTTIEQFNANNIIFDGYQKRSIQDGKISYHQCNIRMRYPDGSEGPLIIGLPRCPTFGVSNKYGDTYDKLSLSIILGEKDGSTEEQKSAIDMVKSIVDAAEKFSMTEDSKAAIGRYDLQLHHMEDMSPMKIQKDKETKRPLTNKPPILAAKFMVRNNKETEEKRLESRFYVEDEVDEEGRPLACDPHDYIQKMGYCTAYLKVESIYYGSKKFSLQIKVYECDIKSNETGFKSLLRPSNKTIIRTSSKKEEISVEDFGMDDSNDDVEEDRPAIANDEAESNEEEQEEEEHKREPSPPPAKKVPAKRTAKK